jgi:hydrogenase nickel incorporation protein HypA/HybF
MHEVSLVSALVDQIEGTAITQNFQRVLEIRLGIGELSGVEPECLAFCFPEVTRSTILEGARLVTETIPADCVCRKCGMNSRPEDLVALACGHCLSGDVKIRQGREFRVIELEVI